MSDTPSEPGRDTPPGDAAANDAPAGSAASGPAAAGSAVSGSAPAGPVPPVERPHAPEIKKPSAFRRLSYALFSRETGAGRFLRSFLLWLLLVAGLVGLGVLLTFVFLYQPVDMQLKAANTRATETTVDLERAKFDLQKAQSAQQDAEASVETAQNRLSIELTRVQVLRAVSSLKTAQVSIQAKDKPGAAKALAAAQDILKQAQPRLDKIDPKESANIQALFTLVSNNLDRDFAVASQYLDNLLAELSRLDNTLSK